MQTLQLKLIDQNGNILMESGADETASLLYTAAYQPRDEIHVETSEENTFCVFQLEDTMPPAIVFCKDRVSVYKIPLPEKRLVYSPKAFEGTRHLIRARYATPDELIQNRNLACNPYDFHESTFFPHASANVETRGEAVFAARNAIDGMFENAGHGAWPYQSWGINQDPNAEITVAFGREVAVQGVGITLRADFPHDSYWTQATLTFSDGTTQLVSLQKTHKPQRFAISPRNVTSVTLSHLIKAQDDSPFPALIQLEVFGYDLVK